MSDSPVTPRDPIDLRAILARIDRDLAENAKLLAEAQKFGSESRKFERERWIIPLTALVTTFVTALGLILAAIIARLPEILHALRIGAA